MKRNPFWDAQAKQYLASAGAAAGAIPNSLANLAAPGGGMPRAPVPLTAIARPVVNPAMPPPAAPANSDFYTMPDGRKVPYVPNVVRPMGRVPSAQPRAAAPVRAVANPGTPFQYRKMGGVDY